MERNFCLGDDDWTVVVGTGSLLQLLVVRILLLNPPLALPNVDSNAVGLHLMAGIVGAGQRLLPGQQSSPVSQAGSSLVR